MVVAIRQQPTEEQSSEMDTSQKQRKAAELAAAQSASLQDTPPPPPSSSTTRRGKRKDPRDLGTPPREDNVPPSIVSVDKEAPSSPSLDKHHNIRRPQLPTRQQIHNNSNSSQQNPSNTTGLTPHSYQTTSLKPGSGATTTAHPAPSDYKVLTSCIENLGSLDSVSDLLNSPDRPSKESRKKNKDKNERGSHQYSSDKVEAASRAAAAVLSGDNNKKPTSKDFHRQSTELHSNTTSTHHTTHNANTTTVQLPPTLNLENHGSAESIVVSSPSLGSHKEGGRGNYKDDNSSSLSCSNSPASFMLDDSILDPKSSFSRTPHEEYNNMIRMPSFAITPNNNNTDQQQRTSLSFLNPSPTSLEWGYSNVMNDMDQFFDNGGSLGTPRESTNDLSGHYKRKSETSLGFADTKDTGGDGESREEKRSKTSLYGSDTFGHSFSQFANAPIASFGVFGSLSNSSTEMDASGVKQGTTNPALLPSPRNNRLLQSKSSLKPPQAPHLSDEDAINLSTKARDITHEHSHISRGTLQHYDNELYTKLSNSRVKAPSKTKSMKQLLVPADRLGNQLTILRGPTKSTSHYKLDDIVSYKTYEFYKFLREIYPVLEGCTYLLPGLVKRGGGRSSRMSLDDDDDDDDLGPTINVSPYGSVKLGHVPGMSYADKSKLDKTTAAIAKRRVESAIFAFGGTIARKKQALTKKQPNKPDKMSIFRTPPSAVVVSSNIAKSSRGGKAKSGASKRALPHNNSMVRRDRYEKRLRQQYFEHGNRLSWDVQANLSLTLNGAKTFDDDELKKSGSNISDKSSSRTNRCKKCGQIKLGHTCPYASSLARNIGVMVYPSANAHVANEPGELAPALCEMNNFIAIKSGSFGLIGGEVCREISSPGKKKKDSKDKDVSPDKVASSNVVETKGSVATNSDMSSPFRRKTLLGSSTNKPTKDKRSDAEDEREGETKQNKNTGESEDLLFQPRMQVTTDQYRIVSDISKSTKKKKDSSKKRVGDYTYPQVPLTFSQRKSMSDALFSLSKGVPKLTDECAIVLTEARKKNQWDLAVAELMVQVICVLHCSPNKDYTLEGLRRYLLTLGIVC